LKSKPAVADIPTYAATTVNGNVQPRPRQWGAPVKEQIYSNTVKHWAPELSEYLQAASDAACRKVMGAVIEYSLNCTELNEPSLLRVADAIRSEQWPAQIHCEEARAEVEKLDNDYQRVFAEYEWDRSPSAPWVPSFRRYTAGLVICCACIPDRKQAVTTAVFEAFAFERIDGNAGLRKLLIAFIEQHS
jgi:hypothetical protein